MTAAEQPTQADAGAREHRAEGVETVALDGPQPEAGDLYHGLPEAEALALATEGAREQAASQRADELPSFLQSERTPGNAELKRRAAAQRAQPPALVLPDGWVKGPDCYRWWTDDEDQYVIEVDQTDGIEIGGAYYSPDDAEALAARLVEAARIVRQLRDGAR